MLIGLGFWKLARILPLLSPGLPGSAPEARTRRRFSRIASTMWVIDTRATALEFVAIMILSTI